MVKHTAEQPLFQFHPNLPIAISQPFELPPANLIEEEEEEEAGDLLVAFLCASSLGFNPIELSRSSKHKQHVVTQAKARRQPESINLLLLFVGAQTTTTSKAH